MRDIYSLRVQWAMNVVLLVEKIEGKNWERFSRLRVTPTIILTQIRERIVLRLI